MKLSLLDEHMESYVLPDTKARIGERFLFNTSSFVKSKLLLGYKYRYLSRLQRYATHDKVVQHR